MSSSDFKQALINPECSATATPNKATSTSPSGGNWANSSTIEVKNSAKLSGVSMLVTLTGVVWPGLTSVNVISDIHADNPQVTSNPIKNKTAGSGNLFPIHSIKSRIRTSIPFLVGVVAFLPSAIGLRPLISNHQSFQPPNQTFCQIQPTKQSR